MSAADHTVTIEFDGHAFTPLLSFRCNADPTADCRTNCEESACEEGCVDPDNHVRTPIEFCNVCEWMENTDEVETCIAALSTRVTVPVEIEWGGTWDGPDWRFVDGEVVARAESRR